MSNEITDMRKVLSTELQKMLAKTEYEADFSKLSKGLSVVENRCDDLRNMNMTTDQYIDKFLPFRFVKDLTQILCFVHEDN